MTVTVRTYGQLNDAASALSAERNAAFLAGGTLVMRALNEGTAAFSSIVRTDDTAFRAIRPAGATIEIGAGATMSDILANRDLAFLHPAARAVGGPAIRNMATVGGNLFAESPYGDFATALLALDATAAIAGTMSGREIPLDEFLKNRNAGTHNLVSHISVVRPASAEAFRFLKVSRVHPRGISVLSIAAHLPLGSGRIQDARVAYGAMAPTPIRVPAVERALEGKSLDEAGIASAIAVASEGTMPASDAIASDWYRHEVVPVHLKRLLLGETGQG